MNFEPGIWEATEDEGNGGLLTLRLLKKVLFVRRAFRHCDGFRHLVLVTVAALPQKDRRGIGAGQQRRARRLSTVATSLPRRNQDITVDMSSRHVDGTTLHPVPVPLCRRKKTWILCIRLT